MLCIFIFFIRARGVSLNISGQRSPSSSPAMAFSAPLANSTNNNNPQSSTKGKEKEPLIAENCSAFLNQSNEKNKIILNLCETINVKFFKGMVQFIFYILYLLNKIGRTNIADRRCIHRHICIARKL